MSITLTCRCQARIQVKDELAGRSVKCPKCGEVLTVPQPPAPPPAPADEDEYQLAPLEEVLKQGPTCPVCQADMPQGAVLCVKCGYHLLLRKHIGTEDTDS